jgi:hypothetical protein
MKKLLIITNVIWVSIFCFIACDPEEEKPTTENCKTISSNYSNERTSGRISPIEATTMAQLYYKNHFPEYNRYIAGYLGKAESEQVDARSVWFSLETLKQYLWEIESKSTTCKGCETLNLGVRIYYGEYAEPDTQKGDDPTQFPFTHKKMHSVFMVPTYAKHGTDGKLRDYDFNPNQLTANIGGKDIGTKCQPITLMEYVKSGGTLKEEINKVAFSNTLMSINFLDEKFILTPNPKSLVKTIAVEEMDRGKESDLNNEKDKKKSNVKKVMFNTLNMVGGNYIFQNHGTLCPPYCTGGEDYFAQ